MEPKLVFSMQVKGKEGRSVFTVGSAPTFFGSSQRAVEKRAKGYVGGGAVGVQLPVAAANTTISGVHFKVWYEARLGQFFISDCGSTNGTSYADPAPSETLKDYEYLGDRFEDAGSVRAKAVKPLATFKAAEHVFVVEDIVVPPPPADYDHSQSSASRTGGSSGADLTLPESKPIDTVIQFLRGPIAGAHHVREHPYVYAIGRAPGKPSVLTPGFSPILIDSPDPHLSRHHLNIHFPPTPGADASAASTPHHPPLPPPSDTNEYILEVLSTAYYCRKESIVELGVDFDKLTWKRIDAGSSKKLRHDDLVRAGPLVFLITSHAEVPRKMDPPHLLASSPSSLYLKWDKPLSATAIRGYVLAVSDALPGTPRERWRKLYGGPKREFVATDLTPSTYYWFRIHARNSGGDGPWSNVIRFLTVAPTTDPSASSDNLTPTVTLSVPQLAPLDTHLHTSAHAPLHTPPVHTPAASPDDDETATVPFGDQGPVSPLFPATPSGELSRTMSLIPRAIEPPLPAAQARAGLDSDADDAVPLIRAALASSADVVWRTRSVLGIGGQAKVFLAHMEAPVSMTVAVKEYEVAESDDAGLAAVMDRINSILAVLEHPNIVRYYGSVATRPPDAAATLVHVFLEYVAGGSLSRMLADLKSGISEPDAAAFARQIVEGVNYLHAHAIVHSDLKGDNVLLKVDGHRTIVKIADFGASQVVAASATHHAFVGTPHFCAPEAIRNERATRASDVWAIGCTLVEMLSGRIPWSHLNKQAAVFAIGTAVSGPARPPSLSPPCSSFLDACFALDPAARARTDELLAHPFVAPPPRASLPHSTPEIADAFRLPLALSNGAADADAAGPSLPPDPADAAGAQPPRPAAPWPDSGSSWVSISFDELAVVEAADDAMVYVCECLDDTQVLVRFLDASAPPEAYARVEAMASVRHPNCILFRGSVTRVRDAALVRGYLLEYVPASLASLAAAPSFATDHPLGSRLRLLKDAASGLYYLHAQEMAHGAVSPWNVLYDARARVCKLGELGRISPFHAPLPGSPAGVPSVYVAPEVVTFDALTPAADVFSLGAICLYLVFGIRPYAHLEPLDFDACPHVSSTAYPPSFASDADPNANVVAVAPNAPDAPAAPPALLPALRALVVQCLAIKASSRPRIALVVRQLKSLCSRT